MPAGVHDAIEARRRVSKCGECAHDQQIGDAKGPGLQQVVEEWQVQACELKSQGDRNGDEQGGIGKGAWTDA